MSTRAGMQTLFSRAHHQPYPSPPAYPGGTGRAPFVSPEEPIVFKTIVLDLTLAPHVNHPAFANPFPVSIGKWVGGKRDGWFMRLCQVEFPMRDFIGVRKCEGRRVPGKKGEVRIVGCGEYGYPGINEVESDGMTETDRY